MTQNKLTIVWGNSEEGIPENTEVMRCTSRNRASAVIAKRKQKNIREASFIDCYGRAHSLINKL